MRLDQRHEPVALRTLIALAGIADRDPAGSVQFAPICGKVPFGALGPVFGWVRLRYGHSSLPQYFGRSLEVSSALL